jgi:hypothetical protein
MDADDAAWLIEYCGPVARTQTKNLTTKLDTHWLPLLTTSPTKKKPLGFMETPRVLLTRIKARSTGVEPATSGSTVRCSNQLSYDPEKGATDYSPTMQARKDLRPAPCFFLAVRSYDSRYRRFCLQNPCNRFELLLLPAFSVIGFASV